MDLIQATSALILSAAVLYGLHRDRFFSRINTQELGVLGFRDGFLLLVCIAMIALAVLAITRFFV